MKILIPALLIAIAFSGWMVFASPNDSLTCSANLVKVSPLPRVEYVRVTDERLGPYNPRLWPDLSLEVLVFGQVSRQSLSCNN